MRFQTLALVVSYAFAAGMANADVPTSAGAARLVTVLQTYLGTEPGVVDVVLAGDAYAVTLDLAPLLAKVSDRGAAYKISPVEFSLIDNGDATWKMDQDQAFAFAVKVPGKAEIRLNIARISGSGLFDEALQAFSASTTQLEKVSLDELITNMGAGETNVSYSFDSARYESTAKPSMLAGVDTVASYSMAGVRENFTVPDFNSGGPPSQISLTAENYIASGTSKGLRMDAIYKLIAFLMANPSEAAITAHRGGLKALLQDGLPFFENIETSGTITAVAIATPLGEFGLDEAIISVAANGAVPNGMVREGFSLKGLTTPAGIVPLWAKDLVPSTLSMEFTLSRFDLAAPIAILLETFDFVSDPKQDAAVLAAFLPDGVLDVTIAPGSITAPIYAVTYESAISIVLGDEADAPTGTAKVTATGLNAVKEALKSAPAEIGMQFAPMLGVAEGMAAKGDGDLLVWDMEFTPKGAVLMNGVDLMGLGQQ